MKKILVTGGLGFIGSHTVVELQNEGFEVIIIDDLSNTTMDVLENITTITGKKPTFFNIDTRIKSDLKTFFDKKFSTPRIQTQLTESSILSIFNLVRMKRNVFKCNKPRGPYHKFGYFPDDGSKQYNRTLYDSLLLSFGGA